MAEPDEPVDWNLATWEESRRNQIRHWLRLSVRERLQAVEDLCEVARRLEAERLSRQGIDAKSGSGES